MKAKRARRDDALIRNEVGLQVEPRETDLAELRAALEAQLSSNLVERLEKRGIRTVADLRDAGGIREATRGLEGARVSARLADELEAHLRLSVLPTTATTNASLVRAGFTTLDAIADQPRKEFVSAVNADMDADTALAIHKAASVQTRYLSNILTGTLVGGTNAVSSSAAHALAAVIPETCGCDCRDATSPVAYLADLLDYAVKHLRSVIFANGLTGEYFDGIGFGTKKAQRVDPTVNFNWGAGAPDPAFQPDAFSVRWTGTVRPRYTDGYTFHVAADDGVTGVRLWVDGQLIVQKSGPGSGGTPLTPAERYGSIYLTADQRYDIKLEYVESGGPSNVRLMWSSWEQPKETVPQSRLSAVERTEPVTLSFLEDRFHQPFRGLPERCEYMEDPIRQVRIACEVLRGHLPSALAGYQYEGYVEQVYRFLLERMGTSYEELRAVATSTDSGLRRNLAARLGIIERAGAVVYDHIDDLFIDIGVSANLTEDALDSLFGYRSTTRPPLDVGGRGAVLEWRLRRLRQQWYGEDWPQSPPADARPLIDPDLVGAPDFKDSKPTVTYPRPLERPMDFFEDRQRFVQQTLLELDSVLANPLAGFESLITSTFTDVGGQVRSLLFGVTGTDGILRSVTLGLGISVASFEDLTSRRSQGDDVAAEIRALKLDEEGFDLLAQAWTKHNQGTQLTGTETRSIAVIFTQHTKRQLFSAWRNEEKGKGLTLSPDWFQIRPPARPGFEFPWQPARFRSTEADRRAWQDKLRARIEREQVLIEQMEEAVAAAEEAYLAELRNALLNVSAGPGLLSGAKIAALTDRLQLDMQAGVCQTTTRVAQAIETIQGALFGARHGLLEGHDLELDDERRFDEAWRWLGSYSTWKAAMRVFVHPEIALRPTLLRDRTAAFDELVDRLRAAGRVTPESAERAADAYSAFFRDVCSLSFAGLGRVSAAAGVAQDSGGGLSWLILARGGHSGKLYFCTQDKRPEWWLAGGFKRGLWNAVPGLDETADVANVVSFAASDGRSHAGVYVTAGPEASRKTYFTSFDGVRWTAPRELALPTLLASARFDDGFISSSPALAGQGVPGWRLDGSDRVAMLDVDGDGMKELVVVASSVDAAGNRRVGIVRGSGGTLLLDRVGALPSGWDLPAENPVVVRTTLVQSPARRREQLVAVKTGSPEEVGLLGETSGPTRELKLLATSGNGTVPGSGGASNWSVTAEAQFLAADVDGDGFSELVAVERLTPAQHRVSILNVRESGFSALSQQTIEATDDLTGAPVPDDWRYVVAGWDGSQETLHVLSVKDVPGTRLAKLLLFRWDGTIQRLRQAVTQFVLMLPGSPPPLGFEGAATGSLVPLTWPINEGDAALLRANLGLRTGAQELVGTTSTRPDTAVFLAQPSGPRMAWRSARVLPGAGPLVADWTRRVGDTFVAADLDGDGRQELVVVGPDAEEFGVAGRASGGGLTLRARASRVVRDAKGATEGGWRLASNSRYLVGDLDGDGCEEIVVLSGQRVAVLRGLPPRRSATDLGVREFYGPSGVTAFDVVTQLSEKWTPTRPVEIRNAYDANRGLSGLFEDDPDLAYLDEAYYFVPTELGVRLREAGSYPASLDWLRSVYDYERRPEDRKIAFNLVINGEEELTFVRGPDWLRDPLNPHGVAATRKNSYTRFSILTLVRCLLAFADAEFTRATSESLPRARELYLKALELLEAPELRERASACERILGTLEIQIGTDEQRWVWHQLRERLATIESLADLSRVVGEVRAILATDGDVGERLAAARAYIEEVAPSASTRLDYDAIGKRDADLRARASLALLSDELVARTAERLGYGAASSILRENGREYARIGTAEPPPGEEGDEGEDGGRARGRTYRGSARVTGTIGPVPGYWVAVWVPAPSPSFCIPSNPVARALRTHAEVSLHKLRNCRNIAGMELRLAPYAAPTAADVGFAGDGLPSSERAGFQPLPYRYPTLIERTKELVELARQMESSMLSAIQSKDHALYEEMKARHDMALARSEIRLRDLRLVQATHAVANAELQRDRAAITAKHFDDVLAAGLSQNERLSVDFLKAAAALHGASAASSIYGIFSVDGALSFGSQQTAAAFSSLAATSSTLSQVFSTYAAYERRQQDWTLQRNLGNQDVRIGNQEILLAEDNVQVVTQERAISGLQLEYAEEILDFLTTRRTGTAELYEWMSGVLEQIYRFFLQQATAMAKLAEAQLAFERQEILPAFIREDYWEPPAEGAATLGADIGAPDRHGLTGSARLLRDVTELDQYAFRTEQRKLQLTKTISIAQLDPFAFERFRSTGVLRFATPMTLFDRDFPGHYLRLIKRVRTSLIALIPPTEGIRATLSTTGTSRVVIGGDTFETVVVQRGPESVALTAPVNATGLFELNAQPEILAPFEGVGVDAAWEFSLPKAANLFEYNAIADLLLSIDYTALQSYDYRVQLVPQLDRRIVIDRPFMFRHQFADAWYDLHNPEEIDDEQDRMVVHFRTERDDFPPNIDNLTIRHVGLLFALASGETAEVEVANLRFEQDGTVVSSGTMMSDDGIVSTRRANANNLGDVIGSPPVGVWELSLNYGNTTKDAAIRNRFKDEKIEDILFVVTYAGETPPWPE